MSSCWLFFETAELVGVSIVSPYQRFIYSPTDALVTCLKNNIKICNKTVLTCIGVEVTPSSGSALICAY